ncbi:MAG: hypothetical protein QXQ94_06635 [Candidatus Bathyarchaeia archaeon]
MEEKDEKSDKQSDKKLNDTQTQSKNETQSQQPREEEQKKGSNPSYPTILWIKPPRLLALSVKLNVIITP